MKIKSFNDLLFLCIFFFMASVGAKPAFAKRAPSSASALLNSAKAQFQSGRLVEATQSFYRLSVGKGGARYRSVANYHLAVSFYRLGIYDVSSLYAYKVLNSRSRYRSSALKVLLANFKKNYNDSLVSGVTRAITGRALKLNARQISDIYFFLGHRLFYLGKLNKAENFLRRVRQGSSYFYHALYDRALLYVEKGQVTKAKRLFVQLLSFQEGSDVTDTMRITALMSLGRIHYQTKEWGKALSYYRQIPKDSSFWHAALFESTWVLLQNSRLRSVLGNLHSLQSDYYEYFYLPESFFLRALVYLYICRYDEMEKVLKTYNQTYNPLLKRVRQVLSSSILPSAFYNDILLVRDIQKAREENLLHIKRLRVPYVVMKHVFNEPEIQGIVKHLDSISEQRRKWGSLPQSWKRTAVGRSAWNTLKRNLGNNNKRLTFWVVKHLKRVVQELESLDVQMSFARYEMINRKKESYKESLRDSSKKTNQQIDSNISYKTYLQNGYDYWTFQGEYWLDEIGNYYYLGGGSCE